MCDTDDAPRPRGRTRNGKEYLAVWARPDDISRFRGISAEHFADQSECLKYFVQNFDRFVSFVPIPRGPRTY